MEYQLDKEELLHAAVASARRGMHDRAIGLLKQLVERDPAHAGACYLLGAEYAEIEMFDRAREAIGRALELNPSLHTARFQLGLLHAMTGSAAEARQAWGPLEALGDDPLNLYRRALELLLEDDEAGARERLFAALAADETPGPLQADMRRLAESLSSTPDTEVPEKQEKKGASRFLLARYGAGTEDTP